MNIDFLHNQIIRDTITQRFIESFNENLVPYLISEYGSSLTEVQFYEDHLASGFRVDGEFHYPLTLVCDGRSFTRWIKWPVANYRNYDKFNPYTYKGAELLEFELLEDVSDTLKAAVAGRPIYADASAMPVVVASNVGDKTFLAGKYSQGFVDALSRAITDAIEQEFDISGLAESGVVLEMRFTPGTFMEHVVENSTYRRILIKARGCAPRDLWIKWTRLDGRGTYTISDYADTDEIIFEIADEVPGKIREKEYRYLAIESVEKYQAAMSRKNMTEWREMMRRVIRRGEVEKCETEPKLAITAPADEPLDEIVEAVPEIVESAPVTQVPEAENDALKALLASLEDETDEREEIEEEDDDLSDLLKTAIGITTTTAAYTPDEEEAEDEESVEDEEEIEDEVPALDDTPVRVVSDTISEDKIRLEMEKQIRAELEEELRRKNQEAEELRARLEAQLRAEMREKELMAEAARAAIQEQQRLAKEREEAEALAREEEARRAAEQERAREEARIANERAAEEARIRRELEAREKARQEAEAAAEAAKAQPEVKYVSKVAKLIFKSAVDPSITKRIHEIILATIKYYHKEDVYIKIKATIPDSNSINLEFVKIPESEISLLVNIIKVLGRSDLGITRATLD